MAFAAVGMRTSQVTTPSGDRIVIRAGDDYDGLSTTGPCFFSGGFDVYQPGATTPSIQVDSKNAYVHAGDGMLHIPGRAHDGKTYTLHASFPQIGLEHFDFNVKPGYAGVAQNRFLMTDRPVAETHPGELDRMGHTGWRGITRTYGVALAGAATVGGALYGVAASNPLVAFGVLAVGLPLTFFLMDA